VTGASESKTRVTTAPRPPSSVVSTSESSTLSRRAASATASSRPGASTAGPIRQAKSIAPTSRNEPEPTASVSPDDDPAFTFGGLPSDEEAGPEDTTETADVDKGSGWVCYRSILHNQCLNRPQSITKVDEIHTSPVRAKVSRRAASAGPGRHRVKNSDLPPGTTNLFVSKVLPLALETAGVLDPWESLHDEDIINIWNVVFGSPEVYHPIASGDVTGDLFLAVKGLVCRAVYYSLIMSFTIICPGQAGYLDVASQIRYGC
jgi:hypothetical protein